MRGRKRDIADVSLTEALHNPRNLSVIDMRDLLKEAAQHIDILVIFCRSHGLEPPEAP